MVHNLSARVYFTVVTRAFTDSFGIIDFCYDIDISSSANKFMELFFMSSLYILVILFESVTWWQR